MKRNSILVGAVVSTATVLLITKSPAMRENESLVKEETNPPISILTAPLSAEPELKRLQEILRTEGVSLAPLEKLGWSLIRTAQGRPEPGYYNLAKTAGEILQDRFPESSSGDLLLGHSLHGLHRFAEAEMHASRAVERRGSPADYGLLGDTQMEQGRLEEAIESYQAMVDLKPDAHGYLRVAHLRFLRGDLEGALEASRQATRMVSPRNRETFSWVWSQAGELALASGEFEEALRSARLALSHRPDSAKAHVVLGKTLLVLNRAADSLTPLRRAVEIQPSPRNLWVLEEALRETGSDTEADQVSARLLETGDRFDTRSFATYLAHRGVQLDRARGLVEKELESRKDIYTWLALSRVQAAQSQWDEAWFSIDQALREGTRDPRLTLHAARVALRRGDPQRARDFARQAALESHGLLPSERQELHREFSLPLDVKG